MILKSKLLRNTFWAASGNASMAVVSFAASIFVVRNLGPVEFGVLQETMAYFLVLQNFENIVNPNLLKKRMLEHPSETPMLVRTVGTMIAIIGLIFTLGSMGLYFYYDFSAKFLILTILLSAMIFRFSNGISFYFDARLETIKGQVSLNVGNTIASAYKVGASYLAPTSLLQAFSMPLQYFCTMLIHIWQYLRVRPDQTKHSFSFATYVALVTTSFALFLSTFVDIFKNRLPFMYLGQTVSPESLGLFSAGVKLTEPWLFVASALSISFWPKLVKSRSESPEVYKQTQALYFSAVFYFFTFVALGGVLLGDFFVHSILGPKYFGSEEVFRIQALALIPQSLSVALSIIEINQGLAKFSLLRNLLSLLIMIALLVFLTPAYGIAGSSAAVLFANLFSAFVAPLFFQPTRLMALQMLKSPFLGPRILAQYRK